MPEAFLSMAPKIPSNACLKNIDGINVFDNKVESVLESIEKERDRRNEKADANADEFEQGLSENDLKKLQKEDLTDEESDAIINKALQNSNNVSLEETKNSYHRP